LVNCRILPTTAHGRATSDRNAERNYQSISDIGHVRGGSSLSA